MLGIVLTFLATAISQAATSIEGATPSWGQLFVISVIMLLPATTYSLHISHINLAEVLSKDAAV